MLVWKLQNVYSNATYVCEQLGLLFTEEQYILVALMLQYIQQHAQCHSTSDLVLPLMTILCIWQVLQPAQNAL